MVEEYKLTIKEIINETPDAKTFRMAIPGGVSIDYLPGQFFMVRFEGDEKFHRAYSVASSPTDKNIIDITFNLIADFTKKLFACKKGDVLLFKGPYGKFYFDGSDTHDIVMIAGGLGVTPMRSIIRYCEGKKLSNKLNLLYSVKTPEDIVYKQELEAWRKNPSFKDLVTITRPPEHTDWQGQTGRITKEVLQSSIENVQNSTFYLCGALSFVKNMIGFLEELGASKEQFKTDIWGNYESN